MKTATLDDTPFFVLGSQRSGTTMLRLILNRHPRLAVPHESKFIIEFYPHLDSYGDLRDRGNAARLLDDIAGYKAVIDGELITDKEAVLARDVSSFPRLIDAIMSEKASQMGKQRWGDKTPYYTAYIDQLCELFPQSKIIHLVRDGRDAAVSQRRIEWMSNNLVQLARDWAWKTTLCHKVGVVLGAERYLEVRYEDLVRDAETVIRKICDFLGEEFASEMTVFSGMTESNVPRESLKWHQNSIRPPDSAKLEVWRTQLSVADRIIFEQNAGQALDLFGYQREHRKSTLSSKLKGLYYAVFRRW